MRMAALSDCQSMIENLRRDLFSNLLGAVYRKGNIIFSSDGNSIISPVGNRVTVFDLRNNKSETLPIESHMNITSIALSPDGYLLILVNEEGEALLCSLISKSVLHHYHFHHPVHEIKFSPDGKKFAVTRQNMVLVFHAPGRTREFNPFVLIKTYYGAYDETVSIDWTSDSRAFCVGSKDMNTRVYAAQKTKNLVVYSLGGHSDCIVGSFFEHNSLDLYTVSQNGHVCVWDCNTDLSGLIPFDEKDEESNAEDRGKENDDAKPSEEEQSTDGKILYKRTIRHSHKEARGDGAAYSRLSSAAYHKRTRILVCGFQDGGFFLHEMPDFNLIHSLSISDQAIASIAFNKTGDWIALACSGLGQLLVWEWQSETYVMKQQGHFNVMTCLEYSPDGQFIVTGGDDGKVKVWNTGSGFCFVTFSEHIGGITGVTFNKNGQVILSSSLDGTVRAFDLNRYRNFRTFTSPRPSQFSCLAIDNSGDVVCAGALDSFEIFVWSMQTGRLLEVLSGHQGPLSSLSFSSGQAILASGSWDKTVKLWDVFENKGSRETMTLLSDVLDVSYRPDGNEIAVASLDAQITFWNPHTGTQVGSIEGRHDIGYTRKEMEKITAKKSSFGKAFSTICYTADGSCILAAGRSKNVCIYSVADQILLKKFEITCNLSFDGMQEFLDKRKMTDWGSLSLVDEGAGDENGKDLSLPGVRKGDLSSRHFKPEVRVATVRFSPTGRSWASATTEGLLVYSLDHNLVFDPFELEMEITPINVRKTLSKKEYSTSLMLSFRLNEQKLIQEVIENIPYSNIEVLSQSLPDVYVDKLISFLATQIETSAHIEFYLLWVQKLLICHGPKLKQRSQGILSSLRALQKNISKKYEDIGKLCDHNKYNLDYLLALSKTKRKHSVLEAKDQSDSDSEMLFSEDGVADVKSDSESSVAMLVS